MTRRLLLLLLLAAPMFAHEGLHEQIAEVTQRIERAPRDATLYLKRAELYRLHEEFAAAARDYDRAAALHPHLHGVDLGRGLLLTASGHTDKAVAALRRYAAEEPGDREGHIALARALVRTGRAPEGAAEFTIALRSVADPDIAIERANALLAAGKADDALAGLDQMLARLGPVVTLQLAAIDIETNGGNIDEALRRIDAAMAVAPRKESWLERRGDLLARTGRQKEAREAYEAALRALSSLPLERRATRAISGQSERLQMKIDSRAPRR